MGTSEYNFFYRYGNSNWTTHQGTELADKNNRFQTFFNPNPQKDYSLNHDPIHILILCLVDL